MFSQMHSLWNFHLVPDWDRMLAVVHLVVVAAAAAVHIGLEEDLHTVHLCIGRHIVPVEEAVVAVAAVHMQEADRMEVSAQATVDQVHPSAAAEDPAPLDQDQLEVEMGEVSQVL